MATAAAAGASAVGSIIGGITGGKAAKKQAKAITKATADQIAFARENRDYQYGLNAPQITYGRAADDRIAGLLNLGGDPNASRQAYDAWRDSTGYQRRLEESLQSVNQRAFAGGQGQSGAALKALQDRGAYVATQDFGNYLGQVGGVSATGAGARGLVAGVGSNATNAMIGATQNGLNQQIGVLQNGAANTQSTIQNLINSGLYAYGSSYGKPGGGF